MCPLGENIEPTEALELFIEDIWVEKVSLPNPEIRSGLKSDDEDDGAKVACVDPTG